MDKYVKKFDSIEIESDVELDAVHTKKTENNIDVHEVTVKWDRDAINDKSYVGIELRLPMRRAKFRWTPYCQLDKAMRSTWMRGAKFNTMLAFDCPVTCVYDADDRNEYTVALSEVKRNIEIISGYEENGAVFAFRGVVMLCELGTLNSYTIKVRVDRNNEYIGKTLDGARKWWEEIHGIEPMYVPEDAKLPMYSTWYSYHQDITDKSIEKEARLAAELGMKSIIVDDGWQLDTCGGGYGYTGDWNVVQSKIRDMKSHVDSVRRAGLKYILWFSVPFVGYFSDLWDSVCDKVLYKNDGLKAAVLDPRYPEIRRYLIDKYKRFAVEYEIDGFKLDFIDSFYTSNEPPKTDDMDYEFVCDAVERLMTDVKEELAKINPDILIEFRQRYTGPVIRKFGNMLRVGDCARDGISNRVGITDIRMLAGDTAVHSDMIIFDMRESVEDAAWQIINSIFGVIQYSVRLESLSPEQLKMSKFWLNFSAENREVLLNSEYIAHEPHCNYPIIEAFNNGERIAAVYARNKILPVDGRKTKIINATPDSRIYTESDAEREAKITTLNCMGDEVCSAIVKISKGVNVIDVPRCGLVVIE